MHCVHPAGVGSLWGLKSNPVQSKYHQGNKGTPLREEKKCNCLQLGSEAMKLHCLSLAEQARQIRLASPSTLNLGQDREARSVTSPSFLPCCSPGVIPKLKTGVSLVRVYHAQKLFRNSKAFMGLSQVSRPSATGVNCVCGWRCWAK